MNITHFYFIIRVIHAFFPMCSELSVTYIWLQWEEITRPFTVCFLCRLIQAARNKGFKKIHKEQHSRLQFIQNNCSITFHPIAF